MKLDIDICEEKFDRYVKAVNVYSNVHPFFYNEQPKFDNYLGIVNDQYVLVFLHMKEINEK